MQPQETIDHVELKLAELSELMVYIKDTIMIDHQAAEAWFRELKDKYDQDELTTEDGSIEREINNAMRNVIESTNKVPKILDAVSKILSSLVKERALLKITGNSEKEVNIHDPQDRLRLMEARSIKMLDDKVERSIYEEK